MIKVFSERRVKGWLAGLALTVAAALVGSGCSKEYPQDSPDAVVATAKKMIENGDARRLTELVYADSKDMRRLLGQIGRTMGSLQDLATAVQKAYPKEIEKLKVDAEEAAKKGEASSFIQKMIGQATSQAGGPGSRRRGGQPRGGTNAAARPAAPGGDPEEMRATFDNALKELFADPYGWIAKSEGRLTVQTIADDRAAIMWDKKPVFGVGLMMRLDKGRWYVELPTYAPGFNQVMPKTPEGWEILGGLFVVFEKAFDDLATDVKKGKCRALDELAGNAGEKMFLPAVMVVFAYGQFMDAEKKAAKESGKASVGEAQRPGVKIEIGTKAGEKAGPATPGASPSPAASQPAAPK